ncbi:unnamed protein product [Soboliphyme baturini]|uniref:Cnd3 domain-containing protein n=1 Tax=Soboliphyme baturini TaxID=241478 RepID=A0A183IFV8_9BILA|nr:unnamed protein product [Soboliphyme baturini]
MLDGAPCSSKNDCVRIKEDTDSVADMDCGDVVANQSVVPVVLTVGGYPGRKVDGRNMSGLSPSKPATFFCMICNREFTNVYYKRHMIVHTNARPYVCSFCGKRFNELMAKKAEADVLKCNSSVADELRNLNERVTFLSHQVNQLMDGLRIRKCECSRCASLIKSSFDVTGVGKIKTPFPRNRGSNGHVCEYVNSTMNALQKSHRRVTDSVDQLLPKIMAERVSCATPATPFRVTSVLEKLSTSINGSCMNVPELTSEVHVEDPDGESAALPVIVQERSTRHTQGDAAAEFLMALHDPCYIQMKSMFQGSQCLKLSTQRLSNEMMTLFEKANTEQFTKHFFHLLCYALRIKENSPIVDSCLRFAANFAARNDVVQRQNMNIFRSSLFTLLLSILLHPAKTIRARCCQYMRLLLDAISESEDPPIIDNETFDRLLNALKDRVKDKVCHVRATAASALIALYKQIISSPSFVDNDKDPNRGTLVRGTDSEALQFLLRYDPSPEVRASVIQDIAINKRTLAIILERCRDEVDIVRKAGIKVLSTRVQLRHLSISQRNMLISQGLNDQNENVRDICKKKLIPAWLDSCHNNVAELIWKLDVITHEETVRKTLFAIFDQRPKAFAVKNFNLLNDRKLIEEINCEKMFYWFTLISYIVIAETDNDKFTQADREELLDSLLPTLPDLTDYIKNYVTKSSCAVTPENTLSFHFIASHLFRLLSFIDLSDEFCRKYLKTALEDLLSDNSVSADLYKDIVPIYFVVTRDIDQAIAWVAEKFSEYMNSHRIPVVQPDSSDEEITFNFNDEKNVFDEKDITKFLVITKEVLQLSQVQSINATLRYLFDKMVVPAIQHDSPSIRVLAFQVLSLYCVMDKQLATKYAHLFLQTLKIDVESAKIMAIKALFDLTGLYGIDVLEDALESSSVDYNSKSDNFINLLSTYLDKENSVFQTLLVEGYSRLLIYRIIYSPALVSRMILMWFNPVSKGEPAVRRCIGAFLPMYAISDVYVANQEALEEAFLPTLRALVTAPLDNPLSRVDPANVVSFLIRLTSWEYLGRDSPGKQVSNKIFVM